MNQKGFVPIIGVILLVLIVGGGAYYLGIQKNKPVYNNNVVNQTTASPYPTITSSNTPQLTVNNSQVSVKVVNGDIVVVNNGNESKITSWGFNSDPVLSPDNTKVAYISKSKESITNEKIDRGYKRTSTNVWIINVDGSNPMQLTQHINFVYRGSLHWLDNNSLLFTDGAQSARVYTLSSKTTQTALGPVTPKPACLDACGFDVRFFYNKDYSYLVRIEGRGDGASVIGILNTQTLKGNELPEQQFSANLETVTFSTDNKVLLFKAYKGSDNNQQIQVSVNLLTQQATTH